MRRFISCAILLLLIVSLSLSAVAHPGRTDANGGHWNRATGEYHYHNGSGAGKSGTAKLPTPTLPPVEYKSITEDWMKVENVPKKNEPKSSDSSDILYIIALPFIGIMFFWFIRDTFLWML